MDSQIDQIERGVDVLHEIAKDIGGEVAAQEGVIAELDSRVEIVIDKVDNANVRMKEVISGGVCVF